MDLLMVIDPGTIAHQEIDWSAYHVSRLNHVYLTSPTPFLGYLLSLLYVDYPPPPFFLFLSKDIILRPGKREESVRLTTQKTNTIILFCYNYGYTVISSVFTMTF